MKPGGRVLSALLALQALLIAAYLGVEASREESAAFTWEALDEAAPTLEVEHAGRPRAIPGEQHVVHFWATWCAPCLVELPGLLEAAEAEGIPLLAVTDEPWPAVQAWFGDKVPAAVVRSRSGEAAKRWQVSSLPDSFVVADGRMTARLGGTRDWPSQTARRFLREVRR